MTTAVSFSEILPLAFVMIAGPQIVTSFFLATSGRWAANSLAYVLGAAISVTTTVTVAYFVAKGVDNSASGHKGAFDRSIDGIVLVLMLFLIVRVYLTRGKSQPPKWMGKLQTAEPRFALLMGLALMGVFPTDIASSVAAGFHVERSGDPWWQCLPFVALTLLLLAMPALCVVILGRRADVVLPRIRDWMNSHSWVISEIVLVFFAAIAINGLIKG
ncbi:GAP family protein [Streptomyces aculeolatus]|uniref:GAP family protein n=1 Tax=Streptomyces aculeolatus TaxID=270689 RepID=UPI001CECB26C|nr:GAP family protein [Streptomyces aculeolatus]